MPPLPDSTDQILDSLILREALDKLSSAHAKVLRLTLEEGLTQAEIAERLGLAVGTVKSRTFKRHAGTAQRPGRARFQCRLTVKPTSLTPKPPIGCWAPWDQRRPRIFRVISRMLHRQAAVAEFGELGQMLQHLPPAAEPPPGSKPAPSPACSPQQPSTRPPRLIAARTPKIRPPPGSSRDRSSSLRPGTRPGSSRDRSSSLRPGTRPGSSRDRSSSLRPGTRPGSSRDRSSSLRPGTRPGSSRDRSSSLRPSRRPGRRSLAYLCGAAPGHAWQVVAAAAAVIIAALVVIPNLGGGGLNPAQATAAVQLYATPAAKLIGDGAATGRATAHQAGPSWTFTMTVHGLKVLPDNNDVYECWWVGPGSNKAHPQLVSGGTFVVDNSGSTTVTMTTGIDPRQFRTMEVTAESPGTGARQGKVLLIGHTL